MGIAERDGILGRFAAGELRVITSCELLSEGFDAPEAKAAILLRPTLSRALYLQQVGRVLRPKEDGGAAVILDFAGNVFRHGLPDTASGWMLKGRPREAGEAPVKVCPACDAVAPSSALLCSSCGHAFEAAAMLDGDAGPGERQRVDEAVLLEEMRTRPLHRLLARVRTQDQLVMIARARGYKPGWVWHAARELGL